ncbi:MAG TPA: hypothetical protein VMI54_29710 [Polyangiaceae bacterium]|nr:hypothetical protein [Polyangiaceae bacterium]
MRNALALVALSLGFVAACGDNSSPSTNSSSGGSGVMSGATGGATASGGTPSGAGTSNGTGGTSSGTGGSASGAPGTGGSATAGQHGGGAGAPASGTGGGAGTQTSGSGGTNAAAGSGGTFGGGGMLGAAGTGTGAGGAAAGSGGSGTGGAGDGTCSRDLLKSTVTAYFTALAAHDPSTLPLDPNVKFTENAKTMTIGQMGLWTTAGMLKGSFSAYDTDTCNSATQGVVPDGTTDIPVSVRLKLVSGKITEIETLAIRAGDYKVSGSNFASDTKALLASVDTVHWEDSVPAAMQNTRDEITAWVTKYFVDFPNGVCNTTSDCKRLENGGGSFSCSGGAGCMTGDPSKPVINPRLILVDTEAGLGVGFDLFEGTDDDTHMFKMSGGMVSGVSAILGSATSTGWE